MKEPEPVDPQMRADPHLEEQPGPSQGSSPEKSEGGSRRWRSRPVLSALVRLAIFVIPILGAMAAASAVQILLPEPQGLLHLVAWWAGLLASSLLAFWGAGRLAARLLPLAALLRLSLLFPHAAPSRPAIARKASTVRHLKKLLAEPQEARTWQQGHQAAGEILTLLASLARHDRGTRGHSERVRMLVELLADQLRLTPEDRDRLRWAALLHDIGKIAVPAEVLNKPDHPSMEEWAVLRGHPIEGMRLASGLLPWLGPW
ncbi:MAG: HD-GYP domain-containing protein, partial [Actinomycetota bacterium]